MKPLFELGQCVATPGALRLIAERGVNSAALIERHLSGDFGDVCESDARRNREAITEGTRVFSAYNVSGTEERLWIITEWDRSYTTILLPSEY